MQLERACGVELTRDAAERRGREIVARKRPLPAVEHVVQLRTEQDPIVAGQRHVLAEPHVDVANTVREATSPKALGLDKMQEAARKFESWDPMKSKDTKPATPRGPATAALAEEQEARRRKLAEDAAAKAAARTADSAAPPVAEAQPDVEEKQP